MEIKIQINNRVFSLCFGHETKWFSQAPWFMITEEIYEKRNIVWAKMIFCSAY